MFSHFDKLIIYLQKMWLFTFTIEILFNFLVTWREQDTWEVARFVYLSIYLLRSFIYLFIYSFSRLFTFYLLLFASIVIINTITIIFVIVLLVIIIIILSQIKLPFVHVLLSSQSPLLQYTTQCQLILHLMHLQLLGLQSLPLCPTFLWSHLWALYISQSFYFLFVHPYISRYGNINDLNFLLGFINNTISGRRASILVSHWTLKSQKIQCERKSITTGRIKKISR